MADTMTLKLVTPQAKLFDGAVTMFVAPGQEGEFGVLAGHDPWFVALGMGPMTLTKPGGETKTFFLYGGYCQIDDDNVVMLAEVCEPIDKIDIERAKAAKQRAEERINNVLKDETIDRVRAEAALRRALYRLEISGHQK